MIRTVADRGANDNILLQLGSLSSNVQTALGDVGILEQDLWWVVVCWSISDSNLAGGTEDNCSQELDRGS